MLGDAPNADDQKPDGTPPSGLFSYDILKKRSDFLRAARGKRVHSNSFVLQAWNRRDAAVARVGFTCSKKLGNAVARNRAKRRLREVVRLGLGHGGRAGWDYVLIGRRDITAQTPFATLQDELAVALGQIHRPRR